MLRCHSHHLFFLLPLLTMPYIISILQDAVSTLTLNLSLGQKDEAKTYWLKIKKWLESTIQIRQVYPPLQDYLISQVPLLNICFPSLPRWQPKLLPCLQLLRNPFLRASWLKDYPISTFYEFYLCLLTYNLLSKF